MATALSIHPAAEEQGQVCAICQTAIAPGEEVGPCPGCRAPFHHECWEENGGCATYGCPHVPSAPKDDGPAPGTSYWGQEEKTCPQCGNRIRMAALRCRLCGKVFESRAPDAALPGSPAAGGKGTAALLFVAGLLPPTAPLALLVGGPLLWAFRRQVRGWPTTHRVMAYMGVAAAAIVTAIVALALAVHAAGPGPRT